MPVELASVMERLESRYGAPPQPATRDPFETILFEQIAYLASDARRAETFEALRARVGLAPARILAARPALLSEIATLGGIHAAERAERMRASARLVLDECAGDLRLQLRSLDHRGRMKLLRRFPMIGEPGAEKVLLFAGLEPLPALDSNGLRVLARVWLGGEGEYAATYRAVRQRITADQAAYDLPNLVRAHHLLRRHGQNVCNRKAPGCASCPLAPACTFRQAS
jgi:endonuclease-3